MNNTLRQQSDNNPEEFLKKVVTVNHVNLFVRPNFQGCKRFFNHFYRQFSLLNFKND